VNSQGVTNGFADGWIGEPQESRRSIEKAKLEFIFNSPNVGDSVTIDNVALLVG
jgi:hypothetical protein